MQVTTLDLCYENTPTLYKYFIYLTLHTLDLTIESTKHATQDE